jgi:hypothetical protein
LKVLERNDCLFEPIVLGVKFGEHFGNIHQTILRLCPTNIANINAENVRV